MFYTVCTLTDCNFSSQIKKYTEFYTWNKIFNPILLKSVCSSFRSWNKLYRNNEITMYILIMPISGSSPTAKKKVNWKLINIFSLNPPSRFTESAPSLLDYSLNINCTEIMALLIMIILCIYCKVPLSPPPKVTRSDCSLARDLF